MNKLSRYIILISCFLITFSIPSYADEEVKILSSMYSEGIAEWIGENTYGAQNSQDFGGVKFDLFGVYMDKDVLAQSGNTDYLSKADNEEQFRTLLERLHYFPEPYWDQFMADLKERAELVNLYFGEKIKFVEDTDLSKARVSRNKYFEKLQRESLLDTIFFILGIILCCLSFVLLLFGVVEATGYLGSMVGDVMGFRTAAQKDLDKASLGTFFGFSVSWLLKCGIIL